MNLVKTISTEIDNLGRRIVKALRLGKDDVQTALEAAPFGIDGNPAKDLVAVYSKTGLKGREVIIGYINRSQMAATGELRTYSVDENGDQVFYTWLKADGTMELGGDADNLARFSNLKSGFDELKADLNDLKTKWNAFATAYVPGGPSSVGLPPTAATSTASTASIDSAKIDEIKTL